MCRCGDALQGSPVKDGARHNCTHVPACGSTVESAPGIWAALQIGLWVMIIAAVFLLADFVCQVTRGQAHTCAASCIAVPHGGRSHVHSNCRGVPAVLSLRAPVIRVLHTVATMRCPSPPHSTQFAHTKRERETLLRVSNKVYSSL